jgi:hydroxymethylpyrimidine pyrophosphatase-like HAD family hydrolase
MKNITIAFDCDGTLLNNTKQQPIANERIRTLLIALASFKNTRIVVWSGGGELYARQVASALGISSYVDTYAGKNPQRPVGVTETASRHVFKPDITPDIAIDDIQDCDLGIINLIVREK